MSVCLSKKYWKHAFVLSHKVARGHVEFGGLRAASTASRSGGVDDFRGVCGTQRIAVLVGGWLKWLKSSIKKLYLV